MTLLARGAAAVGCWLLLTGVLSGCELGDQGEDPGEDPAGATSHTELSEAVDVAALHESRTAYLGDNSRVVALADAVATDAVGDHTLELQTDRPPYVLTITFSSIAPGVTADVVADLMTDRAALLLATIENADEVRWELPDDTLQPASGSLTREQADALTGSPVAQLGATAEGLDQLVRELS